MTNCFQIKNPDQTIPVIFITKARFTEWAATQDAFARQWAGSCRFTAEPASLCLIPDSTGKLAAVWCGLPATPDAFWQAGQLPMGLPEGEYHFDFDALEAPPHPRDQHRFALAFGLGSYQFSRYKAPARQPARLLVQSDAGPVESMVESLFLVRDLINLPADDMGPGELAAETVRLAGQFGAQLDQIEGDDLLIKGFGAIHAVGRASDDPPRLLDLRWGNPAHPKVTLVGKGVCFDTGGLDIKPASAMQLMKKDMGGAAHVLGLARLIMASALPIRLRVLIPAVENAVGGGAYRPGDVITMRSGKTVEVGNTDAEGRLVLADALSEAVIEEPALLIDMATLTGAARVAVGTEMAAFFCDEAELVNALIRHGEQESDPLWRLPLYKPYREALSCQVADLNNATTDSYAGAITAALFLQDFVPSHIPWVHFDLMGWNTRPRPGRPVGGEAMGVRALFAYLSERFG